MARYLAAIVSGLFLFRKKASAQCRTDSQHRYQVSGDAGRCDSLRFTRPVHLGDTVTARVEVVEILPKRRVRLTTTCRNQRGEAVIDGEATVLVPDG